MDLPQLSGLTVYPGSLVETEGMTCFLASQGDGKRRLGVLGEAAGLEGQRQGQLLLCPLSRANAAMLCTRLAWLRPVPLGLHISVGFGDRLGLATPGHVRAARRFNTIDPIFAQQSVRESTRTGRTPREVLDDAMWGLFQEGWRERWGADADHLKSVADADSFVDAGYTLFTIDPGDQVDDAAQSAAPAELEAKVSDLPWQRLEDTARGMEERYLGQSFDLGDFALVLDREMLWRAAAKYGRAVDHTVRMYRHLVSRLEPGSFELEVSVDETAVPTSPAEHLFVATELRRLGVRWVSLAPRFVGRFEKGVDYIGDPETFAAEFARHAAVAQEMGPYKLSLHSGSDKFSIYPAVARLAGELFHLKTAGTSYLEALRNISQVDPAFFREILTLARARYETDRATYHLSAQLDRVPAEETLADKDLPGLLEQPDGRQVLHVTFGSVLDRFRDRLLATLYRHQERYYSLLEAHLARHLAFFAG